MADQEPAAGGAAHRAGGATAARDARRSHPSGLPPTEQTAGVGARFMTDLIGEIRALKAERRAAILAHNYQRPEVQDVADVVADSLRMARSARELDAPVLVICGVHFMAETAAIANPDKRVLIPDPDAGCSRSEER